MDMNQQYRNSPCYNCLCIMICKQKDNFPKVKDQCAIIYEYIYPILSSPRGQKLEFKDRLETCTRLVATCEQLGRPPWIASLIQFLQNEEAATYDLLLEEIKPKGSKNESQRKITK